MAKAYLVKQREKHPQEEDMTADVGKSTHSNKKKKRGHVYIGMRNINVEASRLCIYV